MCFEIGTVLKQKLAFLFLVSCRENSELKRCSCKNNRNIKKKKKSRARVMQTIRPLFKF